MRQSTTWKLLPALSLLLTAGVSLAACSTAAETTPSTSGTVTTEATSTTTAQVSTSTTATTAQTVADTAAAAQAFLATLSEEQRNQVRYAYDDETKSTSWSNFPVTFVDRAGLNLHDLTEEQQAAALKVLRALLNDDAYATVTGIMGGDEYLHENSTSTEDSLGQYYIALFGDPSDTTAWALQFGGHHLGINADLQSDAITFAPTHLGSQPLAYTDDSGVTVSPMASIYQSAFAFYTSLTEEQRTRLYQGEEVATMVCAPGSTCDYPTGTGLSGADLSDEQKELLLDLIRHWAGMSDEETTANALADISATLDQTYVNWSGATVYDTTQGEGIYFQISGPDVYIEFASQRGSAGADVDGLSTSGWGHVHTIYRDPGNDYAGSVTQQAGSGPGGGPGDGSGDLSGGGFGGPPNGAPGSSGSSAAPTQSGPR